VCITQKITLFLSNMYLMILGLVGRLDSILTKVYDAQLVMLNLIGFCIRIRKTNVLMFSETSCRFDYGNGIVIGRNLPNTEKDHVVGKPLDLPVYLNLHEGVVYKLELVNAG